jgi:hypothetical protein
MTSTGAREPHQGARRAGCGLRAGRCPSKIQFSLIVWWNCESEILGHIKTKVIPFWVKQCLTSQFLGFSANI